MSGDHPYRTAPKTAFWSRSVSKGWDPREIVGADPILKLTDKIVSAGSCFAANLVPHLEQAGFTYLRTEQPDPAFSNASDDRFGYNRYSAAYGNIYTARQLLQLLRRCTGQFKPREDRWHTDDGVVDPFRPGLPYPAQSDQEFDLLRSQHLERTLEALESASVFIFTLGLTESWLSSADGAVFPACPGTVAGRFNQEQHEFKNFSVSEVAQDLKCFVDQLRQLNRHVRFILTVSPVPLVATATQNHVVAASTYSKSVLRVVCAEVEQQCSEVLYFPSYEIVTGPQCPDYFEADRRSVSELGVEAVMNVLLSHCEAGGVPIVKANPADADALALSSALVRYECEEMMVDKPTGGGT